MKICFVGWGDHVHVERWAGWFARAGERVSVVSVSGRGTYPGGVEQYGLNDTLLGRVSYRWRLRRLGALLRRIEPDVVHVHWAHFAALLHGIWEGPLVVTVWGSDIYRLDRLPAREREALVRSLQRADLVTCDSQDQADAIRALAGLPPGAVEVVQWGVDTRLFAPEPRPSGLARSLGVDARKVFLSPRNFTPLYNLDRIVEAFALVHAAEPGAALLLKRYRGDPEYAGRIEALIERHGLREDVKIVTELAYEDMPEFYRAGRFVVSIPDSDGTPMSLLEGMACGCVPIVSDLASVTEWVTAGLNGVVVPRDATVEALATAMRLALADDGLAAAMAARNVERVRESASQDAHMTRMLAHYRRLSSPAAAGRVP